MSGETHLDKLLALIQPNLLPGEFVFCNLPSVDYEQIAELQAIALFQEAEGLSLILERAVADKADLDYSSVFRRITLSVHSSLDAVGFTAAITGKLAEHGISTNVVAAFFHDHLFVPAEKADKAMALLRQFEKGVD